MKKSKNKGNGGAEPNIPAAIMERLRQAFQKSASPPLACPEPERVIGCALEELEASEAQQVEAHLLTCRDCLELFLDVRLAREEAESPAAEWLPPLEPLEIYGVVADSAVVCTPPPVPLSSTREGTIHETFGKQEIRGRKVRDIWQKLVKPRRLIPALAAVSLVVLVFILGSEDRSRVLPPADLALKRQAAPTTAPDAVGPEELIPAAPSPAPPARELQAAKRKVDAAAPALEKSAPAAGALSESGPLRLDLAKVPAPGGGARLSYRADRDAFAYLLRQDHSGAITLLFSGKLEGGKTYLYPAQDLLRQSDLATEQATFYLVASEKPVGDLQMKIRELERQGINRIQSLFPDAAIRSLAVTLP